MLQRLREHASMPVHSPSRSREGRATPQNRANQATENSDPQRSLQLRLTDYQSPENTILMSIDELCELGRKTRHDSNCDRPRPLRIGKPQSRFRAYVFPDDMIELPDCTLN